MSESVSIPVDLLAETRAALDAALSMEREAFGPGGRLAQVRAKIDAVVGEKAVEAAKNSDTIQRRSEALERKVRNIAAMAEDVARQLKELKAA